LGKVGEEVREVTKKGTDYRHFTENNAERVLTKWREMARVHIF
jgi:hypothetical protein